MNTLINTSLFWDRVKNRLQEKKATYEHAALACGFNVNTFRSWVAKSIIPSTEDTFRLAYFLDLSVEFLVSGKSSAIDAELAEIQGLLRTAHKRLGKLDCHSCNYRNAQKADTAARE